MPDNKPTILTCPTCGAPLEVALDSSLVRCRFCHNLSIIPGITGVQAGVPPLDLEAIRELAGRGNLLEAIRLYREQTHVGLKEAKQAVEDLQAGRLEQIKTAEAIERQVFESIQPIQEIRQLLAQGNKLEAVKRYRETFDVSLARARYAVERLEAGETAWPEAGFPAAPAQPSIETPARSGLRLGGIIAISVVLFVGGLLALLFLQTGGPSNPFLILNGPAVLLPAAAGEAPDVVGSFYDINAEQRLLGRVEAGRGRMEWRSEALPGDGFVNALALDGSRVYAAVEADLLAFSLQDGSLAWQVGMPDRLSYQDGSLLVAGSRVVSLNLDQTLQAYDAGTGSLAWSRRLIGSSGSLQVVEGLLVILDQLEEGAAYSLVFLDPVDGSQRRVITPTCQTSEYSSASLWSYSGLVVDEAGGALYTFYDSSPGCVQRLDLESGALVWQTLADEMFSFSSNGYLSVMDGGGIFFQVGDGLMKVDRQVGTLKPFLAEADFELLPLALAGDQLIVRARRTRGTERFELWGVDASSGRRNWQIDLQDAGPVDPPDEMAGLIDDDQHGWSWHLAGQELVVMIFRGEPNQMILRRYSLQDGSSLGETVVPLKQVSGDFYSIPTVIGWDGNTAYLDVDSELMGIDVLSGEILFDY